MSEFIEYDDIQVGDYIRVTVERDYPDDHIHVSSTNVYEGEVTDKSTASNGLPWLLTLARNGGTPRSVYHESSNNVKTSYTRIEPPIKEGYWAVRGEWRVHADATYRIRERRDDGWYALEGHHLPPNCYPRSRLVKYLGSGE